MASEQGYSNQKKKGKAQFKTIHPVNSNGYSESVIPKYLADKTPGSNCAVDSVTEISNNNGQIEFWEIVFDQTVDAVAGDVIRFKVVSDQKLFNFEFDVIEAISSDTLRVLPISDVVPAIGDTIQLLRFVTAASDDSGNPQVALAPAPVKFLLDGVTTDVSKDTVTPANSKLLPTENLIAQASLSSIDGKFTTLNAKDFATSAKQDTGNSSLSSIDGKFTTLNAKDFATAAKQDTGNVSLNSIDGKFTTLNAVDFATAAKQDTGNLSLADIDTNTTNIPNTITTEGGAQPSHGVVTMGHTGSGTARHILVENSGRQVVHITNSVLPTGGSTLAEQQTQTTAIGSLTETAPATDTASSGLNGRLQRIAQRLTSLIDLFPTSIGTKASAASLSVVLASDQAAIGVTPQTSSGTITQIQKSVGLTAVRATVSGSAPGAARKKLMIKPSKNNTGSVYLGSSLVTISDGLEIIGPDRLEFELDASDYYLISDTAGQIVEIVEIA